VIAPAPLEDFIRQITEIEDEIANLVWGLNTPIRDYAPADQHVGLHADLDHAKERIQDSLDAIYRLVRDVQEAAMSVRRVGA
jgi:hypothetical protein